MKTRGMQLIAGVTMFVLCISVCTTTAKAAIVWEDDFDDEDLEGWTFKGYRDDGTGNWSAEVEGNFSAEEQAMTVLDDEVNVARHNSSTSVGTWSFDMYIPEDDSGAIDVVFMSDGGRPGFDNPGGTGSVFSGNWVSLEAYANVDYFIFWQAVGGYPSSFTSWDIVYRGWHHFDVSRTSDGNFRLWHNGTLRANYTNTGVTGSEYLEVWLWNATGWAIDNIVVNDDTPETSLPWELIAIVSGVVVVVIVLAIVLLRRR